MSIISLACLGMMNHAAAITQITKATPRSQVTKVIAVTHPTRRRSRSSTRQVCCLASGTPARLDASSVMSTRPSSFSFIDVSPFQRGAEGALGVMDAGLYGAEWVADHLGDLLVAHSFEKPQHEHLAVIGGQVVQGRVDVGGVFL